MRDNSVFLGLCTSHVSRSGWIKKTWYSSSPSSSIRKSGTLLYSTETVFLGKLFPKWMVMGHFCLDSLFRFTVYILFTHGFTVYILFIHRFTVYILFTYCLCTVYALKILKMGLTILFTQVPRFAFFFLYVNSNFT